jgi:hypothetical protein
MNFTHMNFENSKFHTFFILKKLLKRKFRKNRLKQKNGRRYMSESNAFQIFGFYLKTLFFAAFQKTCMKIPSIYKRNI